ncbi:MAG: nuclear transport factor 2 family protein [Steroidobacteraceae bacterium]
MNSRLPAVRRIAACFGASLLLAGAVCAHEGETHASPAGAPLTGSALAVAAVLGQYATALSVNELEAVRPLIADESAFTYFEGSHVDHGWQSYREHLAPEMALFEQPSYRISDVRPFIVGDLAYATYAWAFDVTVRSARFEGGRHRVSMTGTGTAVLSQAAGQWRIRHLHTSMAPTRKAGAAAH